MLIMIKNIEEREMPEFVINIQNFIHSHAVAFSAGILILAYIFISWEKILLLRFIHRRQSRKCLIRN